MFNLPIPLFDARDPLHLALAAAGQEAERVAGMVELVEGEKFQRARKRVRARWPSTASTRRSSGWWPCCSARLRPLPRWRNTDAVQDDLFGHVPQKGELFAEPAAITRPVEHTPDTIRALMHELLAEARSADAIPWTPRDLRSHTAMFPYMAEWLKGGEGDRLLAEFKAEMDRLHAPADQVAPNWRRIWGLAA